MQEASSPSARQGSGFQPFLYCQVHPSSTILPCLLSTLLCSSQPPSRSYLLHLAIFHGFCLSICPQPASHCTAALPWSKDTVWAWGTGMDFSMSEDFQSNRKTRGAQDYSDLGKDIHLRVCTNIVIYCFYSHVSYQVQRGGEESDENSSSGSVFLLSLVP